MCRPPGLTFPGHHETSARIIRVLKRMKPKVAHRAEQDQAGSLIGLIEGGVGVEVELRPASGNSTCRDYRRTGGRRPAGISRNVVYAATRAVRFRARVTLTAGSTRSARNSPVEAGVAATRSGVPVASTFPPSSSPPSGPRSMIQSAWSWSHRGCARSRSRCCRRRPAGRARRAAAGRQRSGDRWWARRGCKGYAVATAGSVASLTRCASPPESWVAGWPSRM